MIGTAGVCEADQTAADGWRHGDGLPVSSSAPEARNCGVHKVFVSFVHILSLTGHSSVSSRKYFVMFLSAGFRKGATPPLPVKKQITLCNLLPLGHLHRTIDTVTALIGLTSPPEPSSQQIGVSTYSQSVLCALPRGNKSPVVSMLVIALRTSPLHTSPQS
jgi:hypothetical protein